MGFADAVSGVLARLGVGRAERPEYLRVGRLGEDAATEHLRGLGYTIVARNARVRMGEADIVARDGGVHVIVEVKTRLRDEAAPAVSNSVAPEESVTDRKRAKLRRIAAWLARANRWERVRIDVVAVEVARADERLVVTSVRHLKDVR